MLRYETAGAPSGDTAVEIEDKAVRLRQQSTVLANLTLLVQLATTEDRVSLRTDKGQAGTVRVTSAANVRVNERRDGDRNPLDVVLFLETGLAAAAGAAAGDPALA